MAKGVQIIVRDPLEPDFSSVTSPQRYIKLNKTPQPLFQISLCIFLPQPLIHVHWNIQGRVGIIF